MDRTPLVRVLFVLEKESVELQRDETMPTAIMTSPLLSLRNEETTVKFGLALFLREREGRLTGALHSRRNVFKADTIAALVTRFLALLQRTVDEPSKPIDLLALVSDVLAGRAQSDSQESAGCICMIRIGLIFPDARGCIYS